MVCFRPLKHWDRGFESHLKHGCLCVIILCAAALWRPDIPCKESYRLCKKYQETEKGRPRPNEGRRMDGWKYSSTNLDNIRLSISVHYSFSTSYILFSKCIQRLFRSSFTLLQITWFYTIFCSLLWKKGKIWENDILFSREFSNYNDMFHARIQKN
jgi:hypothetical protein